MKLQEPSSNEKPCWEGGVLCRLALLSLSQFGRGRLSLVAISFYALSLLFGPCRLSEFTLAGLQMRKWAFTRKEKISVHSKNTSPVGGTALAIYGWYRVALQAVKGVVARSLHKIICSVGWVIEIREFGSRIGNNFPGNWSIGGRF